MRNNFLSEVLKANLLGRFGWAAASGLVVGMGLNRTLEGVFHSLNRGLNVTMGLVVFSTGVIFMVVAKRRMLKFLDTIYVEKVEKDDGPE